MTELIKMMNHDPSNLAKAIRSDITENLSKIKAKTIVISGELDRATPPKLGEDIPRNIENSQHILLAKVTHSVLLECP